VEYIYTGKARIPPLIAIEVLMSANELGLNCLHQICEREINTYLDEANVFSVAKAADYCNANTTRCLH